MTKTQEHRLIQSYKITSADFRTEFVTVLDGESVIRTTVGDLRIAANSSDPDVARVYRELHRQACIAVQDARLRSVGGCAGHQASTTRESTFVGCVRPNDDNPAAHGSIMRHETCGCGAERRVNVNGAHREEGPWA